MKDYNFSKQPQQVLLMVPTEEWELLKKQTREIHDLLTTHFSKMDEPVRSYFTANEFMDAVRIHRSKFDQLVADKKIDIIKKDRKIYVKSSEVSRYFNDPSIE